MPTNQPTNQCPTTPTNLLVNTYQPISQPTNLPSYQPQAASERAFHAAQAASERASQAAETAKATSVLKTEASLVKDPECTIRAHMHPSQRRVRAERLFLEVPPHSVRTDVTLWDFRAHRIFTCCTARVFCLGIMFTFAIRHPPKPHPSSEPRFPKPPKPQNIQTSTHRML